LRCGIQLARNESDDITMNRALGMLNGQILTAVEIEPGSGTTFSFDLGCSFGTCPESPGVGDHVITRSPTRAGAAPSRSSSGPTSAKYFPVSLWYRCADAVPA
jgi:hypothetical protein